ncbi:MAG: type II toxin-antitoxin system VapB family antitoxin [Saprospiraceae bacterium]|nr:type II toxin-antitoxin system VapB family antitoxin [Saprospiraceae bacterium]
METTIKIDAELLEDALKLSHLSSKKAVVDEALKQFIDRLRRKAMSDLRGKVLWEGDLNQMRETR